MRDFPERDWKVFKQVQPLATNRYCERTLQEVERLLAKEGQEPAERFEAVAKLIKDRRKELWGELADYRRSSALFQIVRFYGLGLLREEELAGFSPETQQIVLHLRNR